MSREYCYKFECDISGVCDIEEEESCVGCEFLYDCDSCVNRLECEEEEARVFEGE